MSRAVPAPFRIAAEAEETSEVFIILLKMEHEKLGAPIRVANNSEGGDTTSNGKVFVACPFDISIPSDVEGTPVGQLVMPNVDRIIGAAIDRINTPPRLTIQLVMASTPDDVILEFNHIFLEALTVNAVEVRGSMRGTDLSTEPFPNVVGAQAKFPNLYR